MENLLKNTKEEYELCDKNKQAAVPRVSIIIPVYNVEKYLNRCLDSVTNQTLKDIEIICLNDGSTDNSGEILNKYAQKDTRIKVINKPNGGYGNTCNLGIGNSKGEYIAVLEPDDFIEPDMYEDLYNLAIKNDVDLVKSIYDEYIDTPKLNEYREIKWRDIPQGVFNIYDYPLFLWFHPSIWSCIYRREFINNNNIRFVEAPGAGWSDNPFQVQTMCLAKKICYTDRVYYHWRRVSTNESEDLKDWTIPFKRSDEIHKWLEENKINDSRILKELYKRELAYIHIVLKKNNIENRRECLHQIKLMCERMHPETIKKLVLYDRIIIFMAKKLPWFLYFYIHGKVTRRKLITFKLSHKNGYFRVFGKGFSW